MTINLESNTASPNYGLRTTIEEGLNLLTCPIIHSAYNIKSILNTILANLVRIFRGTCNNIRLVFEDKVGLLCDNTAQFSCFTPVNCFWLNFDSSDELLLFPVIESQT